VGSTAIVIAVSYGVVTVLGSALAAVLWRTTRRRRSQPDLDRLAEGEGRWLAAVVAILVALLFATIFFVPYGANAHHGGQVVDVRAQQFAWTIAPASVKAGESVEFRLTAADVTHGFGVYDPHGKFLFQVQVIPGRATRLRHTFHEPGTYEVLCLEFCGAGHHLMESHFEVTR
jgi:cytochrome c oxidase subunit 2